jgi:hypothetical protein
MLSQYNSFQQSIATATSSPARPTYQSWAYENPMRSIPCPFPNFVASFNLGQVDPGPIYSSRSSIGASGGTESNKSDLYASSSSLNNGCIHLAVPVDQSCSFTHGLSLPKQDLAKKPSSRIHGTPAVAGLRNAVLNCDQAREYFRMKRGARNLPALSKGTQGRISGLQIQSSSEESRKPTKTTLPNSAIPSPWAKSPPGSIKWIHFLDPFAV